MTAKKQTNAPAPKKGSSRPVATPKKGGPKPMKGGKSSGGKC